MILLPPSSPVSTPAKLVAIRSGSFTAAAYRCVSSTLNARALTRLSSFSGLLRRFLAVMITSASSLY
ncbi:MAG: hypothetical protein QM664_14735, partial [Flavihumibacter sp.]